MRQLLVECSDPGLVVSLAEELEHVLKHVDFTRAQALGSQLGALASELGPEFEQAWRGFRLEVPHDGGHPPVFGNRESVDEGRLKELLDRAAKQGVGPFELRDTMLLPQDGPTPETREQYVRDLADSIRSVTWEEGMVLQMPVPLPDPMAAYRQRLMDERGVSVLVAQAKYPTVGWRWVQDSVKRLEETLREVNTRAEAVMDYEVDRLDPADVDPTERIRWAALSVRLGKSVEKWFQGAAESLPYLYQRAALVWLLWTECRGQGPARSFLQKQLEDVIEWAEGTYTTDGVGALCLVYDDLHRSPWDGLGALLAEESESDEGNSLA
jgi:hypothetical protein